MIDFDNRIGVCEMLSYPYGKMMWIFNQMYEINCIARNYFQWWWEEIIQESIS